MGILSNRHTGFAPELRAEAERIAVLRTRALAEITSGGAYLDEAGRACWASESEQVVRACGDAFSAFRSAKAKLVEASQADLAFEVEHRKSPKLLKAVEIGLDHFEYKPDTFLAAALTYDQRVIALIDHLLAVEPGVHQAAAKPDIKEIYALVSTTGRQLLSVVAEFLARIVHDSQITHETANAVEMVWATEGGHAIAGEQPATGAVQLTRRVENGQHD